MPEKHKVFFFFKKKKKEKTLLAIRGYEQMPNSELVFPVMCHFTNFPNGGFQPRREPEQTKYLNRVFLFNCQAPKQSNLGGAEWESIHNSVILIGFYELELFLEAWSEKRSNSQWRREGQKWFMPINTLEHIVSVVFKVDDAGRSERGHGRPKFKFS